MSLYKRYPTFYEKFVERFPPATYPAYEVYDFIIESLKLTVDSDSVARAVIHDLHNCGALLYQVSLFSADKIVVHAS